MFVIKVSRIDFWTSPTLSIPMDPTLSEKQKGSEEGQWEAKWLQKNPTGFTYNWNWDI